MTAIAGFLIGDFGPNGLTSRPIGLSSDVEKITFIDNFPPYGTLLWIGIFPDEELDNEMMERFMEKILKLYNDLIKNEFQKIRMAATLLNDTLENYTLRDIGRRLSPYSFDDWADLGKIWKENWERIQSVKKPNGIIGFANINRKTYNNQSNIPINNKI